MTATYNRRALMIEAHAAAKACFGSAFYKGRSYASLFAAQLTRLWGQIKRTAMIAARDSARTATQRTRDAINSLEGKDRWTQADYARIGVLRAALRNAA
jgi:hypothetical protein